MSLLDKTPEERLLAPFEDGVTMERPRLLLVDDEENVLQIFADLFADREYEVITARTGEEAVARLKEGPPPDLLLTDINLPGVDGLEVVAAAKAADPETVVIVITGYASTSTAIDALRHGASDYITKPFDLWNVDQVVARGIQARRLRKENLRLLDHLTRANVELQRHEEILLDRVRAATSQMSTLYEIGQQITKSLSLEHTLDLIVQKAASLTHARLGLLFMHQESADAFMGSVGFGIAPEVVQALSVREGDGLNGNVIKTGKAEIRHGLTGGNREPLVGLGVASALVVPLEANGRLIGLLDVLDKSNGTFTKDDLGLLELFASQAAIAITNAQLYSRARELDRMKSEFVAVVSHELRTPLTAMKGSLELLADDQMFDINDVQKNFLHICQSSVERLILLINDILDFSKIEASRLQLNIETGVELKPLIESIVENLRGLAGKKKIELVAELAAPLPALTLDPVRVSQVLTNLIGNGVKFSGEETRLTVAAVLHGEEILVTVADQGPGMTRDEMAKLFQKFQQGDASHTRKQGGTGLGLFISRGIVESHGGRIWVESEKGHGSKFCFTLPLKPPASLEGAVDLPAAA